MGNTTWTPEQVKEELPDIMVSIDGKRYPCWRENRWFVEQVRPTLLKKT